MKFLVVGLGSMGKRRVRCLQALGYRDVYGFDSRADRRKEAEKLYSIRTFDTVEVAIKETAPHALIISVPPDAHHIFMKTAVQKRIHFSSKRAWSTPIWMRFVATWTRPASSALRRRRCAFTLVSARSASW